MQTTKEGRRIAWVFVALALIANIAGFSLGLYGGGSIGYSTASQFLP